eukprot:2461192-Prorocentrum_lima.AAC.1
MGDPESTPICVRADRSRRRTSRYKDEILLGEEDQPDQDFIDLEEETALSALKGTVSSQGSRDS